MIGGGASFKSDFIASGREDMNPFVGVGIFWIDLDGTDLSCWPLALRTKWANRKTTFPRACILKYQ